MLAFLHLAAVLNQRPVFQGEGTTPCTLPSEQIYLGWRTACSSMDIGRKKVEAHARMRIGREKRLDLDQENLLSSDLVAGMICVMAWTWCFSPRGCCSDNYLSTESSQQSNYFRNTELQVMQEKTTNNCTTRSFAGPSFYVIIVPADFADWTAS